MNNRAYKQRRYLSIFCKWLQSFKTKQLVRSQAICEAASPPRTSSPYEAGDSLEGEEESNRSVTKVIDDEKIPVQIQVTQKLLSIYVLVLNQARLVQTFQEGKNEKKNTCPFFHF